MKTLLAACVCASSLFLSGCADSPPPADEVREHFRRGFNGEGELGPLDRANDPYVRPREGAPLSPR